MLDFADEPEAEVPAIGCIDYGFLVCFLLQLSPLQYFLLY